MNQINARLEDEIQSYSELLELVQEEKEILLSGDHDRLLETSEKKLAISGRLLKQQTERRRLMAVLLPKGGGQARIRDLEPHVNPESRSAFRETARTLTGLAQKVAGLNERNKQFINEALDTVEHLLGILTGRRRYDAYGSKGKVEEAPSSPRFLAKEV